jgi:hypothetical protein
MRFFGFLHIHVLTYSHTHTHILTHTYSHTHTHTHILTHAHSHTHTRTLTYSHTHTCTYTYSYKPTHTHTHSHTHTLTLTHIRLIRIERIVVSITYSKCRGNSCKWNLEVKRARPSAFWGWVTKREVAVSVWIEEVSHVIKWSKKSYMHTFSYYLRFYNFKIFWIFFDFFWIFQNFIPGSPITNSPGITCYPRRTYHIRQR